MAGHAQLDLLLQLRPSVVADTFTRILNDPITTNRQSAAALPRRIYAPMPGILLWWDAPSLAFNNDGTLTVSVTLAGGVRQAPAPGDAGRIASISGVLRARMKPVLGQSTDPSQITLELEAIDQGGLRASYAGDNALPLLGVGGAPSDVLQSVVRDAISMLAAQPVTMQFLRGLGKRPFIPASAAFPFASAPAGGHPSPHWRQSGELLLIGIGQPGAPDDFAAPGPGLLRRADSNAAVAVSSSYLSGKLHALLAAGQLPRDLRDNLGNVLADVREMGVRVGNDEVVFAARVAHGESGGVLLGTLHAPLVLALDPNTGQATVEVRRMAVDLDTVPAGLANAATMVAALSALPDRLERGYWLDVVATLLGATVERGRLDLTQQYVVPGSQVAVQGRATALELANDALTIYAALPTNAVFVPEPPHRQPKVMVAQDPLHIPVQSAPGQPVDATATAILTMPSYEPYDYAWNADGVQHITGEHGQSFTVRGVPSGMDVAIGPALGVDAGTRQLATASVTVIDAFGQTDSASNPLLVRSGQQPRRSPSHSRPRSGLRVVVSGALIAAVVLSGGIVLANYFHSQSPANPPVLGITPQTDYQQTCTPAVSSLPPIFVTLNNSHNTAAVSWIATAEGTVPGGSESWASLNDTGPTATGLLNGGGTDLLTIQPASDLCAAVQSAAAQQRFTVAISYGLPASGRAGRDGGVTADADAVSLAAASRQVTLSDTIGFSAFSAYVLNADRQPTITFGQSCDQSFAIVPRELLVVLDNARSTGAAQWQLSVPDQVPVTGSPVEPWASADILSGTVNAGARSRVVILLASDICQQLLDSTAPVPLRLVVLANDRNPITLVDTITPPPHVVNVTAQPLTVRQSCASGLQPFTVTLDNTKSNVPVTWRVGAVDSVAPAGTPTPASGEQWASVGPTTGTLAPGPNGTTTVTITPTSDICSQFLAIGSTNDYHVTFTYGDTRSIVNQTITVTDTITNPIQ